MEKAKRKNSPEIVQRQITSILLLILSLSILIYFFPLVWLDSPITLPLQSYALVPLLSVPILIYYYQRVSLKKRHIILLNLCLAMSYFLYTALAPCMNNGCGGGYTFYEFGNTSIAYYTGCADIFLFCLF